MHILYDGQIYDWQVAGGINRYFANIISKLPPDFNPSLLVRQTREGDYPSHPNLKVYEYGRSRLQHVSYRLNLYYSRLEDCLIRNTLARKRFDVFHPTYYTLLTGQRIGSHRAPTVLTVWDMIHERFPSEMDPKGENAEWKRKAILAAQKIICISENTKKDLLERYAVDESRVSITYLASEIDATLSYGPEPVSRRPYYLYVGSRSRYKNFDGLLDAFAKAVSVRPELALCVVGGPFSEAENRLIGDLKLTGSVEHYGYATDSHLAKLYRHSLALVYPSLYEGFGIPPLEAMSCGTVAVVSNVSSLPEVVGDAGVLFDPKAADELIDILLSLADDKAGREALIAKGRERAKQFSWDKTVAQTVAIYRSMSGS
jgi:glycosyltransferase involved in cell wall biosynthesis